MNNIQLSRSEIRKREHSYTRALKHRENNRVKRRVRREECRRSFNPILGRPGGSDDPNRIGLSEYGVKWYLRFLKRGMEPDKARAKALDPGRNQMSPTLELEGSEDDSLRRDSSSARTNYSDSKEEAMKDEILRNTIGLTEGERKLFLHYIDLHFDPDEARGKVMHQRLEQGQPQITDTPASNEQSDKDLEIYCQKYGLTGAERTRFMESMQKSNQLKYAPNKSNISFRSCIKENSMQKDHRQSKITSSVYTNEATDEDKTNEIIPEDPVKSYCILNKIQSSGRKWFLRYIRQGCDLQEAHQKLLERRALQRRLELPPEEQRKIYVWRKDSRPTTSAAAAIANNSKPPLLNNPDAHNRHTQMAVLSKEYPKQTLREEDLAAVEDAVIEEVARGWEINLLFKGINFGPGMLLVDCENVETAKWLAHVAPQLKSWRGVTLKACPRDHIPNPHTVSIYLPNSAGEDVKSIFEAIKSQNDGVDISTWKLLNARDHGKDQTLIFTIDQRSWETISNNQNVLRYGFGMVRVKKKY